MPQPDPMLAEIIAQLQAQLADKNQQLSHKDQALALAEVKIRVLEERLRLNRIARYGKRSETLSDLQLQLLDLEPGVSSEEVEAESEREPLKPPPSEDNTSGKPHRKHPGRQQLPSHLERVDEIVACTPEQCNCGTCGKQTTVIGYEETEVLDVRPVEYFVRVIKREKRWLASTAHRCRFIVSRPSSSEMPASRSRSRRSTMECCGSESYCYRSRRRSSARY
ncbi:MAG: hypothetical protein WBQ94_26765 [Terracidiphilus sp.]